MIRTTWLDNNESLLLQTYSASYTLTEYYEAMSQTAQLFPSYAVRVDIIADFTHAWLDDSGILGAIFNTRRYIDPRMGLFVGVGLPMLTRTTVTMAQKLDACIYRRLRIADSVTDARYVISSSRLETPLPQ